MPWKVIGTPNGKTKYILKNIETGKEYHTNTPKKLERLHEYYKHKGGD